ncbi:MAG TPA: GGDEF domain-containing protein [Polyangia bacterium]|nr:GGDEF domain-containing protein [Polyangia bacterium]
MALDWDDETKISEKDELNRPTPKDRDRAYLIVLAGSSVGEMYKITAESTVIGRGQQADIQVIDEGISRRHAEIMHVGGEIVIRDLGSTNGTYCNGDRISEHHLTDGDKIQVGSTTILKFTFHDSLDESFQRQMYESALRDGLTKIFNKKYFLDRLESEFAYAVRHRTPLSLVMFDIDHFKRINDTHGHLAGDYALSTLAKVVSDTIRQEDVFARYGGEEFAVICRGIDLTGAVAFGERIRRCVDAQAFIYNGVDIKVTVSVGVAAVPEVGMKEPQELIGAADDALYQAKRQGRNRVVSGNVEAKAR